MSRAMVEQARRAHGAARDLEAQARQQREVRDHAVRQMRSGDPQRWTYPAIAEATGLGVELVAAICRGRTMTRKRR